MANPQVSEGLPHQLVRTGLLMLFYRAALPLPKKTPDFTAGIIRRHRKGSGPCGGSSMPGGRRCWCVHLKKGETSK